MLRRASVVIQCHDPYVLGPFWSLVTGLPIDRADAHKLATRTLKPTEAVLLGDCQDSGWTVWISPAGELPPVGRIHLDIHGASADRAAILAAGATVVREHERWTVLADPEGNQFCLFREPHD